MFFREALISNFCLFHCRLEILSCLSLILFSFIYPWTTLEPTTGKKLFKSPNTLFFVSFSLGSYTSPKGHLKKFNFLNFFKFSSSLVPHCMYLSESLLTTKEIWCKDHLTTDWKWTNWIWEKNLKCLSPEPVSHLNRQHECLANIY